MKSVPRHTSMLFGRSGQFGANIFSKCPTMLDERNESAEVFSPHPTK